MRTWVVLIWCLFWLNGSAQPLLTHQQMCEDLEQLRQAAQSGWSYRDYRAAQGVDLDAVCADLQAQLPNQASASEFFWLLQLFTAAMHDGHSALIPNPCAKWTLPGRFCDTDEGVVVQDWAAGGCRVGDRLIAIDGQPVEDCLTDRIARTSASVQTARRSYAVGFLARRPGPEEVCLELESPQGERTRFYCRPQPVPKGNVGPPISHRVLANGIGYLRIATFQQDAELTARLGLDAGLQEHYELGRQAFEALHECPAMVIDLRSNLGGTDRLGQFLASAVLPEGSVYYELESLLSPLRTPVRVQPEPLSPLPYAGRLAVLCNEQTFSAADCFLSALVCNRPDTLVVGKPNGAGAGGPRGVVKLRHSQFTLSCCVMRVWTSRGQLLEGNPVRLDYEIRPHQFDIQAGRDVELEAALRLLGGTP